MATIRKTISLPRALAARLEREARRRRTSFSGLIVQLVETQRQRLPYAGTIDEEPDLSLRVEEILRRRAS